jgi:hypothetical protein
LLERLRQAGQPSAWAQFVKLYTPVLFAWARRLGLQPQDAADLVQGVFTVLVRRLHEFEYDCRQSFRKWLHIVTLAGRGNKKGEQAGALVVRFDLPAQRRFAGHGFGAACSCTGVAS